MWYEIFKVGNLWKVYKVTYSGGQYEQVKVFKTEAGAKNFAKKQWCLVKWG